MYICIFINLKIYKKNLYIPIFAYICTCKPIYVDLYTLIYTYRLGNPTQQTMKGRKYRELNKKVDDNDLETLETTILDADYAPKEARIQAKNKRKKQRSSRIKLKIVRQPKIAVSNDLHIQIPKYLQNEVSFFLYI